MTVEDIVKDYLIANAKDYDGLSSDDGECGCSTSDLAPCGEMAMDCVAGYRVKGSDGYDFCIIAGKKI